MSRHSQPEPGVLRHPRRGGGPAESPFELATIVAIVSTATPPYLRCRFSDDTAQPPEVFEVQLQGRFPVSLTGVTFPGLTVGQTVLIAMAATVGEWYLATPLVVC